MNDFSFEYEPGTARQILADHGLTEVAIDGVLHRHAHELAEKIRLHKDEARGAVQATKVVDFCADLIDPASGEG